MSDRNKVVAPHPPEGRHGYRITLLCDDPGSWIMPWVERLRGILAPHHAVVVCHDLARLPEGDFCFLLGCTTLLGPEQLARHSHNLVVHESDLPRGRGWSPVAWQVAAGAASIPVALLEAVVRADAGPVYLRDAIALDGVELLPELRDKQGRKTMDMVLAFLARWPDLDPVTQQGEPTYFRRRGEEDDRLDVDKPLGELFNRLRVVDNERYPAWFEYNGRRFRLAIHPMDGKSAAEEDF
ncbi:MAG: hypothetical protein AB7E47_06420 [Desulfovibrionaceae bacterium]